MGYHFIKEFIKSSNLETWEDILIDVMNKIPGIYSVSYAYDRFYICYEG